MSIRVDQTSNLELAEDRNPAGWLGADLQAVEEALAASTASEVELIQVAARHVLDAGGKRLRPQLTLLAARSVGYEGARAVPLAAVMELVHTATLVHDDVVDESDSRRGRATVNYYWGNSASVLMGDYLVIQAFSLIARDGDPRLFRLMCDTIARMCEGEVLQICCRGDTELSVDAYCTIIDFKTATLMSSCCQAGGLLADAAPAEVAALAAFGHSVGMAFQIQDDVLDFVGDEETLGKPVGGDLREMKVTLPLIYTFERASAADRQSLEEVFLRAAPLTAADITAVIGLIARYDGFEAAREKAREFVRTAKSALAPLPPSPARDGLVYIADRIVDRDK